MRNIRKITLILFIILCSIICCYKVQAYSDSTEGKDLMVNEQEMKDINGLYDYITKMKDDYEILKDVDTKSYIDNFLETGQGGFTFKNILKYSKKCLFKELSGTINLLGMVIIISIVCSLIKNLQDAFNNQSISQIAYFACFSIIVIVISKSFYLGINMAKQCINDMTGFMSALMPILVMLLSSVGGLTQAALMDPIIVAVTNVGAKIIGDVVLPLIIIGFVLKFINSLSDDYKISNLSKLLNQVVLWIQGIIMTVFVAIITIRSIASKAIDEVTIKTAKFAIDSFIPVVGKCLSDAISTVAGYSLLLKNAIGTLGLIIIIIIMIWPIIKLFIMGILYKLTAALIQPISDKRIVDCIASVGDTFMLIMSSLICVSVMCFIITAIITATGTSILIT